MTKFEIEIPPRRRLMGLAQSAKGWFAYIAVDRAAGQFQGAPGATPQEAIEAASRALDEKIARIGAGGEMLASQASPSATLIAAANSEDLGL